MRKTFSIIAGLFALLAVSCSQEKIGRPSADGQEVNVSFTTAIPESIATKAYSDGKTAKKLHYGVYVSGTNEAKFQSTVDFNDNLQATVDLTLATGVSYDFIFWAQSEDAASYSIDWTAKTMTVDYETIMANDENNDAFYAYISALKVEGAVNQTVELFRPFAQINLGTNDYDKASAAGLEVDRTNMVVTLPNVLNFVDGTVEGSVPATFAVNDIDKTEAYPVYGYSYLEMNYVLAGLQKSLANMTFNVWETGMQTSLTPNIVVSNVPVQRNYRTNIYGSLLTDPANITVVIKPAYEEPDYDVPADVAAIYEAAKNGGEITLESNIVLDEQLVVENDLVINLNGKTINNEENLFNEEGENKSWSLISVQNGTLKIKGDGTVKAKENDCYAVDVRNGAAVVIEGGTFVGNWSCIYVREGHAVINGGEYSIQQPASAGKEYEYVLNIFDEARANSSITVTGGTFHKFNPANNAAEGANTNFVAEGYESVKREDTDIYDVKVKAGDAVVTITTAAELEAMLTAFTEAGSGNNTIIIDANVELAEGEDWTPLHINGYQGAGTITIEGNGHYISGLNGALLKSGFAGDAGVVIKNLTIKNSVIGADKEYAVDGASSNGVFFCYCDSMEELTFENCHIENVHVSGTKYVAGFVAYTAGHADVTTDVTIKDCTVSNCSFTTAYDDSIGGLIAHSGGSYYTPTTITDCTVSGCSFNQADINTAKIGYAIGTVGTSSSTTITNVKGYGNTYGNDNKTLEVMIGRYVPNAADRILTVDDVSYPSEYTENIF